MYGVYIYFMYINIYKYKAKRFLTAHVPKLGSLPGTGSEKKNSVDQGTYVNYCGQTDA